MATCKGIFARNNLPICNRMGKHGRFPRAECSESHKRKHRAGLPVPSLPPSRMLGYFTVSVSYHYRNIIVTLSQHKAVFAGSSPNRCRDSDRHLPHLVLPCMQNSPHVPKGILVPTFPDRGRIGCRHTFFGFSLHDSKLFRIFADILKKGVY